MERMAHSRQQNKVSVTVSHKINHNGSFSGKTIYDDVYGGPPKFGVSNLSPRFEDYGEIFGSFHTTRASSIPLLDLPVVHETEAFFDPRSEVFNYTEVFNALDFAVSYENLFNQPCARNGVSSDEAWTPVDTDSFSGESEHSANNHNLSNGDLFQSIDDNTEINISYHEVNGTTHGHMSKGNHMTQLHAVPGSSLVYDEKIRFHGTDPSFQVADDIDLDMEFSADKLKGSHLRKTMPHLNNFTSGEQTFGSDRNLLNRCSRNDSHSSEMFMTLSDISLRSMPSQVPPPSRSPPVLLAEKGDTSVFHSKETPCDSSPPFYDMEVDMNSAAAASADVMKEAMPRAEAKLRNAKELKERKKWVYENHVKSSCDVKNNEAKMSNDVSRSNSLNDETTPESYDGRHSKTKISIKDERQKPWNAFPGTLDTLEGKIILNMFGEKHTEESRSSQESDRSAGVGSWKEESEFFELVGREESGTLIQPTKQTGNNDREESNIQEKYRNVEAVEESYQLGEYEKKFKAAKEVSEHGKSKLRSEASNEKWRQQEHAKKEKVSELFELEENEKNARVIRQHEKTKGNEKTRRDACALGQARDEEKLKDSVELEDIDERSNVAVKQDNSEENKACRRENEMKLKLAKQIQMKGPKESFEVAENEKSLKSSSTKEESDEGLKHAFRWDENEKQHKKDFEVEVNEVRLKEAFKQKGHDLREKDTYERDQYRKKYTEACDRYAEGNRPQEVGDSNGIQKILNQAPENEQNDQMLNMTLRKDKTDSTSNKTSNTKGSVTVSEENNHLENMNNDVGRMDSDNRLEKALEQMEVNEEEENKATDEAWGIEGDKNLASQSASIQEENIGKLEVSQESVADQEIGKTRTECNVGGKKFEEIGPESQLANEKIRAYQITSGDAEHSGTQSRKVDDTVTKADYRKRTTVQEAVNVQKSAQWFHVDQSTKSEEESHNGTHATVVKDTERMRREKQSEKEHIRKIEEERDRENGMAVDKAMLDAEREREREKDRMAVDRAAFEARDKAFAEACEREKRAAFERATVEAKQRALADARERLEKVCAEARDKSYIDKAATEARLKAERAAVERANAEAQERALEKLKVERTAFENRERLERSVSDKIGVCFSNGGRQDSSSSDMLDPQFQNFSSSACPRYPYSLYGAASFSERSQTEGESAKRCRARLERHRRTAERAAKALAEKNMRDLIAQKELTERNRIAETLDAEVRRWSSGKEGNLRALLSTLQYILGTNSGWQPIPLTEVITSAAVKKAYRKATLCVHPDKLQQRGASIQHKYICEKVFDLLKDAWNKFNSEER